MHLFSPSRTARVLRAASVFTMMLAGFALPAHADYPADKNLTIVVPYPAGGGLDAVGRILAESFTAQTGGTVVVDNRAGAAGTIGMGQVARARPDGYTLAVGSPGNISIAPTTNPSLAYSPTQNLISAALAVRMPILVVAREGAPFATTQELITYAKAHPNKLSYGSGGNGTAMHLAGEMFNEMAGVRTLHVPYQGGSPLMVDLLAGRIDYAFIDASAIPSIKSGKLKLVAVTTDVRSKIMPDTPTIAEGGVAGYEASNWYGLFLPAGTDNALVQKLNTLANTALADPKVIEKLEAKYMEASKPLTPAQFADFVKADIAKWARVAKAAGLITATK
jgi:tripartite-type tricarboxylate transporter receptor subunit TctC